MKNNNPKTEETAVKEQMAFGPKNYKLLLIGLGLIALGFLLMIGGGSEDPNYFNEGLFNFRRLTLAPILVIGGFVVEVFAILKK
jgi:hypothetical protein